MESILEFKLEIKNQMAIITFLQTDRILTPQQLKLLNPPDPVTHNFAHLGVVLSGRGPIWLYGYLVHFYHPTRWVATYDPRLQGAVVVESHTPDVQVGDIIPIKNTTDD